MNEDSIGEIGSFCGEEGAANDSKLLEYERQLSKEDQPANFLLGPDSIVDNQCHSGHAGMQLQTSNLMLLQDLGLLYQL